MIFVNYRRKDSKAITGRIHDRLRQRFGDQQVFRDIGTLMPGDDFSKKITLALAQCQVGVVVIGPTWVSQRLFERDDFVRSELEALLDSGIPVFPVLVEGAQEPKVEELPASIVDVLKRQMLAIDSGEYFDVQAERLLAAIAQHIPVYVPWWKRRAAVATASGVLLAGACLWHVHDVPDPDPAHSSAGTGNIGGQPPAGGGGGGGGGGKLNEGGASSEAGNGGVGDGHSGAGGAGVAAPKPKTCTLVYRKQKLNELSTRVFRQCVCPNKPDQYSQYGVAVETSRLKDSSYLARETQNVALPQDWRCAR